MGPPDLSPLNLQIKPPKGGFIISGFSLRPPRPLRIGPMPVDRTLGNSLAHLSYTFGAMNPHDPIFIAPPPTEMPDYILYRQYEEPCYLPGRPSKEVFDNSGSPAFCRGYKIRRLFCIFEGNTLSLDNYIE